MPSDKILFPRRMLYVEAVLYVTVAVTAFGLGYLLGRRSPSAASKDEADVQMQGVSGKVSLVSHVGAKQGDEGAVVIILPAGRVPRKRLPIAGLRPGDRPPVKGAATLVALAELGGATARTDASGGFELSVPAAESYRILILSAHAPGSPEPNDVAELGKYFDTPAELLQHYGYRWQNTDLRLDAKPIDVEFKE